MENTTSVQVGSGKGGKHTPIKVISINPPPKEEAQAKIKELSEYLSVAWAGRSPYSELLAPATRVSPDTSE